MLHFSMCGSPTMAALSTALLGWSSVLNLVWVPLAPLWYQWVRRGQCAEQCSSWPRPGLWGHILGLRVELKAGAPGSGPWVGGAHWAGESPGV